MGFRPILDIITGDRTAKENQTFSVRFRCVACAEEGGGGGRGGFWPRGTGRGT